MNPQKIFAKISFVTNHLCPGDWLIMFLFIAFAISSWGIGSFFKKQLNASEKMAAAVTMGNRLITSVPMSQPQDYIIKGRLGEMSLRVADGRIRIVQSRCANQVCVKQGAISQPGEMLVCVPNQVVVLLQGETSETPKSDRPVKSRGDAVTF